MRFLGYLLVCGKGRVGNLVSQSQRWATSCPPYGVGAMYRQPENEFKAF
ncbi:MAG: hypothetical protein ACFNLD_04075 [Kingella oralis]